MRTLFIELDSPWENGYIELSNGKFRDEFFERGVFFALRNGGEATYETTSIVRLHSTLEWPPPDFGGLGSG